MLEKERSLEVQRFEEGLFSQEVQMLEKGSSLEVQRSEEELVLRRFKG